MNILQEKYKSDYDYDILIKINQLKYYNNVIDIKGSSSLKSQQFYSDIDLYTIIDQNDSVNKVFNQIHKILESISNDDFFYFIEYKGQLKNGNKIKLFYKDSFNINDFTKYFKELDYIKLDLVLIIKSIMTEVSIIYDIKNKEKNEEDEDDYIKSLKKDIVEYTKDKKYFKVLKRYFKLFSTDKLLDNEKIKMLSMVFNGKLGEIYQRVSNLEAIKSVYTYYKDKITLSRIDINLKIIKESISIKEIQTKIDEYNNYLNTESLIHINHMKKPTKDNIKILEKKIDKKLRSSV